MTTLLTVAMIVVIGIAACAQARREGIWSWRRFGVAVFVLLLMGGGIGFAVTAIGRRAGPEHALLLTAIAVVAIFGGVFALALGMRRRSRPR
jgi:uncharacterized membrane protein HdeD (DUF308 family)